MRTIKSFATIWLICSLVWLGTGFSYAATTEPVFEFNQNCRQAYFDIISLKIRQGRDQLRQEIENKPENLLPYYIDNYADFLEIFISENEDDYEQFRNRLNDRVKKIKAGKSNSPYYLFAQGELYLQAAVLKIRFSDYVSGIFDIRKALKLLEKNRQKYPEFKPNQKSLGMLYAVLGSVPDKYKIGLSLLGMNKDMVTGLNMLDELIEYCKTNPSFIYKEEIVTMYSFLLFHLKNDKDRAWNLLQEFDFPQQDNLMNVFTCAHIGTFSGRVDPAIDILENRPVDTAFTSYPYLDYLHGLGKLYRLDEDADIYFKRFLSTTTSKYHIKSAYQKMAWHKLIHGDKDAYNVYMLNAKTKGNAVYDADKQALKEAKNNKPPVVYLLKARMLCDGGFYEKALSTINEQKDDPDKSLEEIVESSYRKGRIYHLDGNTKEAKVAYIATMDNGSELKYYYAANAALQLGLIYEQEGNKDLAEKYFKACINMKDHEYRNSLDQKARAGLERVK